MKTYIMPAGWDKDLVLKTAFKSGADKVCLVSAHQKKKHAYSELDTITQRFNNNILSELKKLTQVDTLHVNYIDLKDIIIQLNKYIKDNADDELIINISTGSHMLAATLMLVALMNNIKVEYSIAEGYNPGLLKLASKQQDLHYGLSEILEVPSLPVSLNFSSKEKAFLNKLKDAKKLSVSQFITGSKGNQENRMRSEFNYMCKKLEKQGMVKVSNGGKKFTAELTSLGEILVAD